MGTQDVYTTDTGVVAPMVTEAQMREVDRVAIEGAGPNLFQMMENAGRSLAVVAMRMLARADGRRVVVLAGSGGNGGGGICAARHLLNHGFQTTVVVANRPRLTGVPHQQLGLYVAAGGIAADRVPNDAPHLILDALVGYSLSRSPEGRVRELIQWANASHGAVLSLDVPTGVDATGGHTRGIAVAPDATVTLALPKTGLPYANTGHLWLADLGIPAFVFNASGVAYRNPFDDRFIVPLHLASQDDLLGTGSPAAER